MSRLSPTRVLEQVQVARAFTWAQMVELVAEKLPTMGDAQLIVVAGMTRMMEMMLA
jgi:hypothetical protein